MNENDGKRRRWGGIKFAPLLLYPLIISAHITAAVSMLWALFEGTQNTWEQTSIVLKYSTHSSVSFLALCVHIAMIGFWSWYI